MDKVYDSVIRSSVKGSDHALPSCTASGTVSNIKRAQN